MCNCDEVGLEEVFSDRFARRDARSYRKRGISARARLLLELIEQQTSLRELTTLEGGAGAGTLSVELARRGVRNARALDALPCITNFGPELAREFGVTDRVSFATGDFADLPGNTAVADVVILDRVLCCYPDWRTLLSNAAKYARRVVALTYPHKNTLARILVGGTNGFQKLFARKFRMQLHEPRAMHAQLQQSGFLGVALSRYWFWEIAVFKRTRE